MSQQMIQRNSGLSIWNCNTPGYQFFKKCDIDYVNDLAIKLNTNRYQERVTLRPLRPQLLTIHIDSPDPICSGKLVSEVVDLTNVVKFRLSLPGRCNTVAHWNSISEKLTRVQDLDIALGLIYNVWQFFDYAPKSISRFKITLYGCRRLDDETSESYKDNY
ncbi:hypothetical protein Cantr_06917 [Candida viswanathii]|uniref:Uncharacterized protein n=1 Tax=Candida viswanathii TaxID=5486 RepID=A0A367XXM6_9ASCO|nr:hypothetical protein Cantr_06917 [Candida viswanathii]